MCGIAGIFNKNGEPAIRGDLEKMASAMIRRGPDGDGFFTSGEMGLAHRRLSIIDLETGAQPIANEDGTVQAVVNGEIYNYKELTEDLRSRGHLFRTHSDSECVLHLYEEYGLDFPSRIQGMFAVAIADSARHRITVVTDRAGKKPVFYFNTENAFVFASSIPALAKHPAFPGGKLNLQRIWDYLTFLYVPAPDTIYENVFKLPPACMMTAESGGVAIRKYWDLDYSHKNGRTLAENAETLRGLLGGSVAKRLVADVPLGVFLSGGLDSTVIASLAADIPASEPLKCFSISFDDPAYDESADAGANAAFISAHSKRKIEFLTKKVSPCDIGILRSLCREYGEPFADASIIPAHLLCRFAKEHVTVALSGDGADELFGGYERYIAMKMLSKVDFIPLWLRSPFCLAMSAMCSPSAGERTLQARLRRFLRAAGMDRDVRYLSILTKCTSDMKFDLFGSAFSDFQPRRSCRFFKDGCGKTSAADRAEKVMEYDFHTYLPNDILPKMDTASMATSLEVRSPYLDTAVTEFAASVPVEQKFTSGRRKILLAEAARGLYPAGLDRARKRGFGVPVASWLRGAWKNELEQTLLDGLAVNGLELFRRDYVEYMIKSHCSGEQDLSYQLYLIFVLELTLAESGLEISC